MLLYLSGLESNKSRQSLEWAYGSSHAIKMHPVIGIGGIMMVKTLLIIPIITEIQNLGIMQLVGDPKIGEKIIKDLEKVYKMIIEI